MITNERQYKITRSEADRFRKAISDLTKAPARPNVHPRLLQAEREAMESQLADLQAEIAEYDRLKSADLSVIAINSFDGLADVFKSIKDPASADKAMEKIPELTTKVDGVKALFDKLQDGGMKSQIIEFIKSKLGGLKDLFKTALNIPNIGEKLKPAQRLMDTLEGFTK